MTVQTRSHRTPPPQDDHDSSSDESNDDLSSQPPPSPVHSDTANNETTPLSTTVPTSRFWAPYRTVGLVTSGHPFALVPHETTSHICVLTENRFQILNDRLQPVLVSQSVLRDNNNNIHHIIADASFSVTVVAHGRNATLFHRTHVMHTLRVTRKAHMVQLVHLGRIPTSTDSNSNETAVLVGVLVAATPQPVEPQTAHVPVVGSDSSSSSSSSSSSEEDDDDETDTPSVDEQSSLVLLLATRSTLTMHRRIVLPFTPTVALHPATYINKLLIGGTQALALINIRSQQIIHQFQCVTGPVTALEQSPAVDTIAVGMATGQVHLINLKHDKRLFTLKHQALSGQAVSITSLSFRTDGAALRYNIAPLAVGRSDGIITVWDLTPPRDAALGRTILTELHAHVGGIAKLQYLPQEPVLVSIGTQSNAIIQHMFDNPDHSGRILRQRKGHTAPPTLVQYLRSAHGSILANDGTDPQTCQLLSTGGPDRTLRVFSTARSVLDREFSQGSGLEKRASTLGIQVADLLLPPVHELATSDARRRDDWGDVVTIHEAHAFAYVWSSKRYAQSGPVLKQPQWNLSAMKVAPPPEAHATAVTMSACGNFCLVGTRGGVIYKYNVQSGNPRGSYPRGKEKGVERRSKRREPGDIRRTTKSLETKMRVSNRVSNLDAQDRRADAAAQEQSRILAKLENASHQGHAVVGLAVDSLNKTVVSVGTDKKLILWNFTSRVPHNKCPIYLPCPATKMRHVRESDLAAIALNDFSVLIFDCLSLSVVRRLGVRGGPASHSGPISDLAFSPDGRILFTASMDSTVRIFDVPTSSCVDWMKFKSPPTSLTVGPTGEFIATTHVGRIGISVWSDRSFYQTVHFAGTTLERPVEMDEPLPMSVSDRPFDQLDTITTNQLDTGVKGHVPAETESKIVVPKAARVVTLSGLPAAHWKNLFHLELVKLRNKPLEPPKKPPSAPFFLQWRAGDLLNEGTEIEPRNTELKEDEWAAAWSDDDADSETDVPRAERKKTRSDQGSSDSPVTTKRTKITHYRSHIARLLQECGSREATSPETQFQAVSDYLATIGPSAIDVELMSLCSGFHDLSEGLPLLLLACSWFAELLVSGERFEVSNAYLNRFLHLHAPLLAELEQREPKAEADIRDLSIDRLHVANQKRALLKQVSQLRMAQHGASSALDEKMQQTLCLLRHFSRMV